MFMPRDFPNKKNRVQWMAMHLWCISVRIIIEFMASSSLFDHIELIIIEHSNTQFRFFYKNNYFIHGTEKSCIEIVVTTKKFNIILFKKKNDDNITGWWISTIGIYHGIFNTKSVAIHSPSSAIKNAMVDSNSMDLPTQCIYHPVTLWNQNKFKFCNLKLLSMWKWETNKEKTY